jgi:hypothetical protein
MAFTAKSGLSDSRKKKFAPILQNKFRCPGKVVDFKIQNDFNGLGSKRAWDEVVVEFVII